jgi:hypothetical protein
MSPTQSVYRASSLRGQKCREKLARMVSKVATQERDRTFWGAYRVRISREPLRQRRGGHSEAKAELELLKAGDLTLAEASARRPR